MSQKCGKSLNIVNLFARCISRERHFNYATRPSTQSVESKYCEWSPTTNSEKLFQNIFVIIPFPVLCQEQFFESLRARGPRPLMRAGSPRSSVLKARAHQSQKVDT